MRPETESARIDVPTRRERRRRREREVEPVHVLTIGGLVLDAESGESLAGTQVFLKGHAVGAVAGSDGGYSIWRASDVWLESTGCLPRVSPWLDVWLIPH